MEFLAVLKPDGFLRRSAGAHILKGLADSGLCTIASFVGVSVPTDLLDTHYSHVVNRPFYPWLAKYMSGGPSYVVLLEGDANNLAPLRELLGATRAHTAAPNSLRGQFTPYGGANGLHLSEDAAAAEVETALWKSRLHVQSGQFDMPVEDYIAEHINKPNHTLALRDVCLRIEANNKTVTPELEAEMRALLKEECVDATDSEVDFLTWVLTGAVTS